MEAVESMIVNVVRAMVAHPDDVRIKTVTERDELGDMQVVYVRVHEEDVGGCIGSQGDTARCLRKIMGIAGFNLAHARVFVKIVTPKMADLYHSI